MCIKGSAEQRGAGGIAVNLRGKNILYLSDYKGHDYFFAHSFGERD